MQKLIKPITVFSTLVILLSNLVSPALAVANQVEQQDIRRQVLANIFMVDASLDEIGVDISMFDQLEKKDAQFYQDLKAYVSNPQNQVPVDPEVLAPKIENAEALADQWVYAREMAKINMERDIYAVDEDSETIYMYMSHFVDIKTGILQNVYPGFSNDGYFSAWIVNDDRDAYDSYLNSIKFFESFKNAANISKAVYGTTKIINSLSEVDNLDRISKQIVTRLLRIGKDSWDAAKIFNEEYKNYIALYNSSSTFHEFKYLLDVAHETGKTEDKKYNDFFKENGADIFLNLTAYVVTGLNFGLLPSALSVGELYFMMFKDLVDKARWIGLIQYNNIRVSKRIMRYYSHVYGIDI